MELINPKHCGSIAHIATIVGGVALIVGTIAEDVATLGAGIADDVPSIAAGISMIAGSVPAVLTGAAIVTVEFSTGVVGKVTSAISSNMLPGTFYLPLYAIGPEQIFSNKIALLDVNFFKPNDYTAEIMLSGEEMKEQKSIAASLQSTIAGWYIAIRNLCVVAMFLILIYLGIRIIISSSTQDKAKYKERIMDWLVGMCLLFFMHYFMGFATTVTDMIVQALVAAEQPTYYYTIIDTDGKLSNYSFQVATEDEPGKAFDGAMADKLEENGIIQDLDIDGNTYKSYLWPTNLMGRARLELQLEPQGNSEENNLIRKFGWSIIFIGMVMYTVLFLFRYIRRVIMLAFLTMIAPFVAMTYPLDKVRDGKAQAFNIWLREYLYNLLIQPVHYILFVILISTAYEFASDNMIYALVAFGFMLQAEKIMRKLFGFDSASTLAGGSALGGALAMQGIHSISKLLGGGKGGRKAVGAGSNGESSNSSLGENSGKKPKYKDLMGLMNGVYGDSNSGTNALVGGVNVEGRILSSGENDTEGRRTSTRGNKNSGRTGINAGDSANGNNNANQAIPNAENESDYAFGPNMQNAIEDNTPMDLQGENNEIRQKMLDEDYEDFGTLDYDSAFEQNMQNQEQSDDIPFYSSDEEMVDDLIHNGIIDSEDVPKGLKELGWSDEDVSLYLSAKALNQDTNETGSTADQTQIRMANEDRDTTPDELDNSQVERQSIEIPQETTSQRSPVRIASTDRNATPERANIRPEQNEEERPKKDIKKVAMKAAKYTGVGVAGAAGGIASAMLKTTLAGTGAMVGIAGGLVSDDFSNVAKMGAAGAASGWVSAKGLESKIKGTGSQAVEAVKTVKQKVDEKRFSSEQLKARQKQREEEIAKRDMEARKKYAAELGLKKKAEIDQIMEARSKFRQKNIMDDKIIMSAMKANGFGADKGSDERILLAGMMSKVGERKKEKDRLDEISKVKKAFKSKNAEGEAKKYIDVIKDYYDIL